MKTLVAFLINLIAFGSVAAAEAGRSVKSTQIQRTSERSSGISAPVAAPRPRHGRQNARVRAQSAVSAGMNANTVTVVAGTPGGTYYRAASDLAFVLDGEHLRVLPLLGKGAGQNVYDIRFLRGVDLGFVRLDTLEQLRDDKRIIDPERNITYVARLFNDELHLIAAREITDIRQLAGKRVSFDVKGSGTDYTGRLMFKGLGIEVQIVNLDQPTALDLLKRGELAAVVSVAAKPVEVVSSFQGGDRFHLLPVPYVNTLSDKYFPATLRHEDYPRLIAAGNAVNTLAVGTVLAAFNWPEKSDRYKRIARFVEAFFSKIDDFLGPSRHPKWSEVNLSAEVSGWKRFPAAQKWLESRMDEPTATGSITGVRQGSVDRERPRADDLEHRNSEQMGLTSRTGPATLPASVSSNEGRLLARADTLLQARDISGARRILEHALAERSGVAAFKLAETYDPRQLAQWQVRGVQGDWSKSQGLYERALEAGFAQARQRICQIRTQHPAGAAPSFGESCGLGETP
jgi:uncharacterized protein